MSNRTKERYDVPKWLAEFFRDSFNTLHGTDYIVKRLKEKDTDIDMHLLDFESKEALEDIQHTKADPEWLNHQIAIAFGEVRETLQGAIDKSGLKKDFLLSVLTAPENLPKNKHARIRLVKNLWSCLKEPIDELRLGGIKEHGFDFLELEDLCGGLIADTFIRVRVQFFDREFERNVTGPVVAYSIPDEWIKLLTLEAVQRKADKNYPNPEDLILLVELPDGPTSETGDISGIIEALQSEPPVFKEVWIGAGSMDGVVRVWPS